MLRIENEKTVWYQHGKHMSSYSMITQRKDKIRKIITTTVYSRPGQQGREMGLGINSGGAQDSSQSRLEPQVCFFLVTRYYYASHTFELSYLLRRLNSF